MIVADIPNPYPTNDHVDLKGKRLKINEKWYLGQQITSGEQTVKSITNRYNLNKRTLSDYKRKFEYHLRTCVEGGRPRSLDEHAEAFIIGEPRQNPFMCEAQLRQIIRQKHKDCWNKWNAGHPNRVYKKISIRTVGRYSIDLRDKAASQDNYHAGDVCCTS